MPINASKWTTTACIRWTDNERGQVGCRDLQPQYILYVRKRSKEGCKGTGDPEGIIDAVGKWPIGMAAAAIGEEVVFLSSTCRLACTWWAVCYTCMGELDTPFSLVQFGLATKMEA